MTVPIESPADSQKRTVPVLTSMSLFKLALMMLTIGVIWRLVDVFVLNLGATWLNILPSKLGPLVIILLVTWKYRRAEMETVLGLSKRYLKPLIVSGALVGLSVFILVQVASTAVYALVMNPGYSLGITIVAPELIAYSFMFFLVNAVFEEVLFRGMLQNSLRTKVTIGRAIVLSALVFGVWHACWPMINGEPVSEWLSMIILSGLLGCMFGVYYEKFSMRASLVGCISAHTLINFLNENFKIGPAESTQGPDFSFEDPALTGLMALFFLFLFTFYLLLFTKRKVTDMEGLLLKMKHIVHLGSARNLNTPNAHTDAETRTGGQHLAD